MQGRGVEIYKINVKYHSRWSQYLIWHLYTSIYYYTVACRPVDTRRFFFPVFVVALACNCPHWKVAMFTLQTEVRQGHGLTGYTCCCVHDVYKMSDNGEDRNMSAVTYRRKNANTRLRNKTLLAATSVRHPIEGRWHI